MRVSRFEVRASVARPERKETTGSRVIRPERLMDAFQAKLRLTGLPNGSSSVRLKLWRKLWRISLVNRLSGLRQGRHIVPDTWVTLSARFAGREVWMPWRESSVMEERLRFVARLLDGEPMTDLCREFGISRKTGYKVFNRYREHGCGAFSDRSRRPVRYANQLPQQVESLIVTL